MTSLKPYLIRSIYDWIIDNSMTPHLLIDAEHSDAILPVGFIENGKIVLNIRPEAVQNLSLGNEEIQFNTRFSGQSMQIIAPIVAVKALYAKENGKGMVFDDPENSGDIPPPENTPPDKPKLRVVK